MKITLIYKMACMLYGSFLRVLLKKAIDDPDTEWDDFVLNLCDKVFNYEETGQEITG